MDGRAELLTAMNDAIDRIEAAVRRSVARVTQLHLDVERTGGSERYDRRRRWWIDHHDQFAAALVWLHPLRFTPYATEIDDSQVALGMLAALDSRVRPS